MKVLITGGSGFIGSHLAEYFQGRAEVRVLDNLRTGHRRNLDGLAVEFIEGSITDRAVVRRAVEGVDYVFHLAALVSVTKTSSRSASRVVTSTMAKPWPCTSASTSPALVRSLS